MAGLTLGNALTERYWDLTDVRAFAMPVFFLLGRHDWHVPSVVSAQYFDSIEAPCKRLVWFEQSAHNPPFEQPDKFVDVMVDTVLPAVRAGACTPAPGTIPISSNID